MKKNKTIPEQIWQFFCSVKLTVYTLVVLAVTSIIGTVILQNGTPPQYLNLYGQTVYNIIKIFNFDDMYQAWWFLALIVILCINIVVCSIERLSFTWKIIFPQKITFNPDRFRKLKNLETVQVNKDVRSLSNDYERFLSKKVGRVIKQEAQTSTVMYAEKGRWTRIGVYVVHASILLLLIGALIGSLFGFKAHLQLDEGQTSDTAFIAKKRLPIKLDFSIRCNDFDVKFYDTGAPEEFKSNLTIINNGNALFTRDIRVNHPLRYKGINIFQASYGTAQPDSVVIDMIRLSDKQVASKTLKIGEEIQLPDDQGMFKLEGFLPHFDFKGHNLGEAFVGRITPKDGAAFQIGLPVKFPTFDRMRKGAIAVVIKDFEQKHYTGLQITKDPGIWYVYSGFILLIIGCWITFFMSHQSYFIEVESSGDNDSTVSISGTTNRNNQGMKLKIQKIVTTLKDK
ncbi:cytochrome c biogenesis protein ResB [Desulfobacula sp.]|uniref:cytochrome c biogenesis protein ResB n=1 Tax=Desulfobacula sp. TaxID=2593537 RepID=UPI002611A3E9|nr:cytochrome c biogenesis protein ResB [Desulfobacula sp.]